MTLRTPHWTRSALRATIAIPSLRSLRGVRVPLGVPAESIFGGVVSGARKHLISRCFFLALFGDMNPARFARFRRSRNDTADTALDAIGTPCNDRYSVTSFLTGGGRVPQQAPFERNRKSGFFLFLKSFSNPLTLFSPCTTFACRSDGEISLFRHFVPYQGTTRNKRGIARRKIPLPNLQNTTIYCAFSPLEFLWLSALFPI